MASRALHIGVDGRELLGKPTGVGRYLREVVSAWLATPDWPHRVTLIVPSAPSAELAALWGPRVNWAETSASSTGTVWEQTALPRAVRRAGIDVLFAGAYTAPAFIRVPFVVAIYDVSFWAHPEWFRWREGLRRRWLTRRAARRASTVITISEFSASEIVRHLGVPRQKIVMAPPGAPPLAAGPQSTEPVVAYVGSLFNRRHIPDLIQGFALAAAGLPAARLVLVGDNRTSPPIDPVAIAAAAGVADRVEWREYVSERDLGRLYASARAFAFLSDYEGFAMTPMEALAHGVPSVLLDTPVAREVYGQAAVFVKAEPLAIANALRTLLDDGPARTAVLEAGHACLRRYSWPSAAATIRLALERAAEVAR